MALYRKCCTLWPEHIEVLYRLSTSYKEVAKGAGLAEITAPMHEVRRQLSYRRLLRAWLRTWRPGHWNPGERRYWRSWISPRAGDRANRRTSYLRAVAIAELVAELSFLIPQRNGAPSPGSALPPAREGQEMAGALLARLSALLLRPGRAPAAERLLRPRRAQPRQPALAGPPLAAGYGGPHYHRRSMGWLATFNAACFFSLAIWLPSQYLPDGFEPEEWCRCCAHASIHELGLIHRNPRNTLDPNWLARDLDLEPLRQTELGQDWMAFIGLRPAQSPAPAASRAADAGPGRSTG